MVPVGIAIIAGIIGIAAAVIVSNGVDGIKDLFRDKVKSWNLPAIARNTMKDEKIDKNLKDANIPQQIENAFNDPELKAGIVEKVSVNLKGQIKNRSEDIKYAIENI